MSNFNIDKLQELQDVLTKIEEVKVFGEHRSLCELYIDLAKKINEIIRTLGVMHVNINDEFTEILTTIDDLLKGELVEELTEIMNRWYDDGIIKEMVNEIVLQDIDDRLDRAERKIGIAGAEDYYYPTTVEDCQLGNNGIPSEYNAENLEKFYNWKLNKLVDEFPDLVKKTIEGYDQSGLYPIYKYSIVPKEYDRTVLVLSQVHGNEYTSFFSICNIMDKICREDDNNMLFMREKVKLVVLPIVNPWGFVNGNRRNSRGVDLNRNSSYRWDEYLVAESLPGGIYFKGDTPFSESESLIVKGVVEDLLNDKLVGVVDMHTLTTIQAEKILYYPRFAKSIADKYHKIFEIMNTGTPNDRRILATSTVPTMTNWMAHQYKILACNPEWNNSCYDMNSKRTSFNMTKHVEYMTNIILVMAKENQKAQTNIIAPFTKAIVWNCKNYTNEVEDTERNSILGHRILNSSDNIPLSFDTTRYEFKVNNEGLAILDGTVTIHAVSKCQVTICPLLYQQYAPESNYGTQNVSDKYWQTVSMEADTYMVIPLFATVQVYHTNHNDENSSRSANVHMRIKADTSVTDSAYITDVKIRCTFIPTTLGLSLEILKPLGAMQYETIFPLRLDSYGFED